MKRESLVVFFCVAMAAALSWADRCAVESLPGEKWWGGATIFGRSQPYGDFAARDQSLENFNNQTAPFFVSSAGRYVWGEKPLRFSARGGDLLLESAGKIALVRAGNTLREAFLAAARDRFPPAGAIPPEDFFTRPQYNHAIESHITGRNQASVEKYACAIAGHGFPMGIITVDDYWMKDFGVWEFDPGTFPDPKGMVERLHALGAKVMLWVVPYVSADSLEGLDLYRRHLVVERDNPSENEYAAIVKWWSGYSFAYDFSVPEAKRRFVDVLRNLQGAYGIDGYKFDGSDLRHYTLASPTGVKFRRPGYTAADNCRDFSLMAADFPYNELRASYRTAGLPLVQRLQDKAHTWGAVQQLIPDMLAAGILGYAYTCADMIGGGLLGDFEKKKFAIDHKIFIRSCQVHALMPMMQFSLAPWRVLTEDEAAICRTAAELHVEMGPYIVELARNASRTGEPIVRLMEYAYPHQGFEEVRDQFMLGEEWLVAPIVTPDDSRAVRLPEGKWSDDLGVTHVGPKVLELKDVPLSRIPRYRKVP